MLFTRRGDFVHAGYLSKNYRVVMFDHLGFGFSDKPKDYSYSLTEQAEQVNVLLEISWKLFKRLNQQI